MLSVVAAVVLFDLISERGFRVVIPVVPGQTKATLAYKRANYTPEFYVDWLAEIVEQETKRFDKKPYLVGFSIRL